MATKKTKSFWECIPLLRKFISHRGGAVAVQFAILAFPLTVMTLGLFDVSRASIARQQLQDLSLIHISEPTRPY